MEVLTQPSEWWQILAYPAAPALLSCCLSSPQHMSFLMLPAVSQTLLEQQALRTMMGISPCFFYFPYSVVSGTCSPEKCYSFPWEGEISPLLRGSSSPTLLRGHHTAGNKLKKKRPNIFHHSRICLRYKEQNGLPSPLFTEKAYFIVRLNFRLILTQMAKDTSAKQVYKISYS